MTVLFQRQILIGLRTFGAGEIAEVEDKEAIALIQRGVVAPHVIVREALDDAVQASRKAVKR